MNLTELCKELFSLHCREFSCEEDSEYVIGHPGCKKLNDDECTIGQSSCNKLNRNKCTIEQSICNVIESIALAEAALAHIFNNEGEKLLKAIEFSKDINALLEVGRSVNQTMMNAIELEQAYCKRIDTICTLYKMNNETNHVPDTPNSSEHIGSESVSSESACPESACFQLKPRTAVFLSAIRYSWLGGTNMKFKQKSCSGNSITLGSEKCNSYIMLSAGKKFKISYEIELINKYKRPVIIDMRLCYENNILLSKRLFDSIGNDRPANNDFFVLEIPNEHPTYTLCIVLLSLSSLRIINYKVIITEI